MLQVQPGFCVNCLASTPRTILGRKESPLVGDFHVRSPSWAVSFFSSRRVCDQSFNRKTRYTHVHTHTCKVSGPRGFHPVLCFKEPPHAKVRDMINLRQLFLSGLIGIWLSRAPISNSCGTRLLQMGVGSSLTQCSQQNASTKLVRLRPFLSPISWRNKNAKARNRQQSVRLDDSSSTFHDSLPRKTCSFWGGGSFNTNAGGCLRKIVDAFKVGFVYARCKLRLYFNLWSSVFNTFVLQLTTVTSVSAFWLAKTSGKIQTHCWRSQIEGKHIYWTRENNLVSRWVSEMNFGVKRQSWRNFCHVFSFVHWGSKNWEGGHVPCSVDFIPKWSWTFVSSFSMICHWDQTCADFQLSRLSATSWTSEWSPSSCLLIRMNWFIWTETKIIVQAFVLWARVSLVTTLQLWILEQGKGQGKSRKESKVRCRTSTDESCSTSGGVAVCRPLPEPCSWKEPATSRTEWSIVCGLDLRWARCWCFFSTFNRHVASVDKDGDKFSSTVEVRTRLYPKLIGSACPLGHQLVVGFDFVALVCACNWLSTQWICWSDQFWIQPRIWSICTRCSVLSLTWCVSGLVR